MKDKNENITINKYNYDGYLELYKAHFISDEDLPMIKDYNIKKLLKFITINVLGISIALLTKHFYGFTSYCSLFTACMELSIFLFSGMYFMGPDTDPNEYVKNKKCQRVKEKYPYVDNNIEEDVLEKTLIDAKVIKYELVNGEKYIVNNVREYEDYLKAEEIKENYLNETKYERYSVNPDIEEEELKKVKVKELSLTR